METDTVKNTLTEPLKIIIRVPPVTKKNSPDIIDIGDRCPCCGRGCRSKPLPSKQFRRYQEDCGWFLGSVRGIAIDCPVNIEAHYCIDRDIISDLTNYHAALHDVLTHYGVIRDDNRHIIVSTDGSRVHVDRVNPRTEVTITPIGG
jgi:Holliday junction resolvase RusA-like endonuclease